MAYRVKAGYITMYGYEDLGNDADDIPSAWIRQRTRNLGIHVCGAKGSGKSIWLGRFPARADWTRSTPTIVFDSVGKTIDNLIYKHIFETPSNTSFWDRLVYFDMSGTQGYVVPMPFYYRYGRESDYQVASRFPELIRKLNPELMSAAVQGYNPLRNHATRVGIELIQRGWQVTEMEHLSEKMPDTLRVKLLPYLYDDIQRAIYGASQPGIDWQAMIDNKQTVLLDFRHCAYSMNEEDRRMLMLWTWMNLVEFIKYRGTGQSPISIIIDELYDFTGDTPQAQALLANDLQRFMQVNMRNNNVWLTVAHQTMDQFRFAPTLQNVLLDLGTQVIGQANIYADAIQLAQRLFQADPNKEKRREARYDSRDVDVDLFHTRRVHEIIDEHIIDSSLYEQYHEYATEIMNLEPLEFFLLKPDRRGFDPKVYHWQNVLPISIKVDVEGEWNDDAVIATWRDPLVSQFGIPIEDVLAEINQRTYQRPPRGERRRPSRDDMPFRRRPRDDDEEEPPRRRIRIPRRPV
jgi:hypothetical protein